MEQKGSPNNNMFYPYFNDYYLRATQYFMF